MVVAFVFFCVLVVSGGSQCLKEYNRSVKDWATSERTRLEEYQTMSGICQSSVTYPESLVTVVNVGVGTQHNIPKPLWNESTGHLAVPKFLTCSLEQARLEKSVIDLGLSGTLVNCHKDTATRADLIGGPFDGMKELDCFNVIEFNRGPYWYEYRKIGGKYVYQGKVGS